MLPPPPDQGGWGSASAPRPIERLLGPGALWAGPYSLLGLRPGPATDDTILAALDNRLAQIARHPERDAPEADEARLALHAAAAQLLDPSVRRHLEARWSSAQPPELPENQWVPPRSPGEGGPGAPAPRRSTAEIALEHDAVVTLGLYGGWNQRALRRLTMLAHARGLSSQAVAMTLQRLASPRAATQLRAAGGLGPAPSRRTLREQLNAPDVPDADEIDPAARIARRIAIIVGALAGSVAASAILVAIVIAIVEPGDAEDPRPEAPPEPRRQTVAPPEPRRAADPQPAVAETADADAAARALRTLAGNETVGYAEAMTRFDEALAAIEASWPDLSSTERVAATDAVVEFLYRAVSWSGGAAEAAARIGRPVDALSAGTPPKAADILPAIWSAGALTRLARERDVPSSAQQEIRRRLTSALGPRSAAADRSFESGAAAAIGAFADRLSDADADFWSDSGQSVAAWNAWQRAVDGLAGGGASGDALRERLTLAGLEALLARGPQPNQSERAFDVVRHLTSRLRWRPDQLARPTLLRWFDDQRMVSADLHAVTNTLARSSSAEGVDITMVVPIGASDEVRANFRSQYATAWGLGAGVDRDQAVAGWRQAAQRTLAESDRSATPPERLARAVRLSRLSEAASWAWRGQIEAAAARVADLDANLAPPNQRQAQWPQLASGYTATRSPWAESYLAARRNIPLRSARLDEAARGSGHLHVADAELIVTEAILGSPAEIRRKAAEVTLARANSPSVTNALLEVLARAPATRHASELIQSVTAQPLPDHDSDQWRPAARRVLVERLLQQVAAEGDHGRIDRLADQFAASYAARAADRPDAVAPVVAADADPLAAALWTRWIVPGARAAMASAPVPLPEIEARTGARLKLATSTVERFAARQAGILELMALAVVIERPDRAGALTEIIDEASQRRARASHILEQIEAVEEAMLRIWMHRLGGAAQDPDRPVATPIGGANS